MLFKNLKIGQWFIVKPKPEELGSIEAFRIFMKVSKEKAVNLNNAATSSFFPEQKVISVTI